MCVARDRERGRKGEYDIGETCILTKRDREIGREKYREKEIEIERERERKKERNR